MKYTFNIKHYNSKFEVDDDFNEWITSNSSYDARRTIEKAYPESMGYRYNLIKMK